MDMQTAREAALQRLCVERDAYIQACQRQIDQLLLSGPRSETVNIQKKCDQLSRLPDCSAIINSTSTDQLDAISMWDLWVPDI